MLQERWDGYSAAFMKSRTPAFHAKLCARDDGDSSRRAFNIHLFTLKHSAIQCHCAIIAASFCGEMKGMSGAA